MRAEEAEAEALQAWWKATLDEGKAYYDPGKMMRLPEQACASSAFHPSCQQLLVRRCFDALYKESMHALVRRLRLVHINGNAGVGKSAFLWYFIIRTAIDRPGALILYETSGELWEFRGTNVQVFQASSYPRDDIKSKEVTVHLINQKVDVSRPIGSRAVVAASPDKTNTKEARKLRTTTTLYMPPWDKHEFDALTASWARRADLLLEEMSRYSLEQEEYAELAREEEDLRAAVKAAAAAFSWLGGIPGFVWDRDVSELTEARFVSNVLGSFNKCKLKHVSSILRQRAPSNDIFWRLFHFKPHLKGSFKEFQYAFCSDMVAGLYAQHLHSLGVEKMNKFLKAAEPFPEYGALRGFVFEQFVIVKALDCNLMATPMVDDVFCGYCRDKSPKSGWIQCDECLSWQHLQCAEVESTCTNCQGKGVERKVSGGGLELRYYEGDLEAALLNAGEDAVKYLWRPLLKNNSVFDFVVLPNTLGHVTVSKSDHPVSLLALGKALKALKAWRQAFHLRSVVSEDVLLFLLPPDVFSGFRFQRYRTSGKVAKRAVKGVVQCKMAVPLDGAVRLLPRMPSDVPEYSLDLSGCLESWETSLGCERIDSTMDFELEEEEFNLMHEEAAFKKRKAR